MKISYCKRIIGCLFFLSVILFGQNRNGTLREKIDSVETKCSVDASIISINVYDLTSGKTVYSKNDKLLLHPASNQKILTSTAALHFLGRNYEFSTRVFYDGIISGGVLKGNIYIVGGGDPLFSLRDLDSLTDILKKNNIVSIEGNIYGDVSKFDSTYWGSGWMWDDDPSPDAPYITPLSIGSNAITLQVTCNKKADTLHIVTVPQSAYFEIHSTVQLSDTCHLNLEIQHAYTNQKNCITVSGTFNKRDSVIAEAISILKPEYYFLQVFRETCLFAGITIRGDIGIKEYNGAGKYMGSHTHRLIDAVNYMNKVSDNLSGELLLRNLGALTKQKNIHDKDGIRYVDSLITLAGHDPRHYRIVDGSGLSHYNLASAELINDVLKYFYYEFPGDYELLRNSFPNSGYDGTLKNRMNKGVAVNNVYAKTGTLSGISCLSGYIHSTSNTVFSFSILIQNFTAQLKQAKEFQDKICEILAAY